MRLRAIRRLMWFPAIALVACEAPVDQNLAAYTEDSGLSAQTVAPLHGVLLPEVKPRTELTNGVSSGRGVVDQGSVSVSWLDDVRRLISEERYEEARDVLTAVAERDQQDAKVTLVRTGVELLDENYATAYSLAQSFLLEQPEHYQMLERRAMASLLGHDVETALVDFQTLVAHAERQAHQRSGLVCDPLSTCCQSAESELAQAKTGLATVQYNLGDLDVAEKLATEVVASASDREMAGAAKFVLALSASKRGKDDVAFGLYQDVLDIYPENPAVLNNIGGVYYRIKDLRRARDLFVSAYEHAGMDRRGAAIAWSNVAEVDMLEGKFADAEDKLLESIATSPGFAGAYFTLAALYDVLGNSEESQKYLGEGLRLDEQGVVRWNSSYYEPAWEHQLLAMIADYTGDLEDSLAHWRSILNSDVDVLKESARRHIAELTGY